MAKKIIGVDPGNFEVKAMGENGTLKFFSNLCEVFEQTNKERWGRDDMYFNIEGRRGYAGTIAKFEDEYGGINMMGDTKAHEDAKIRILLALHQYCNDGDEVYLVTGQPIKRHQEEEKQKIKDMLIGRHQYEVNGTIKTIFIEGVEVAPEGTAAIFASPAPGLVRILDCGSGTINAATLMDKKHISTQSTTFNFGAETINTKDFEAMGRGIVKNAARKWGQHDNVLICGGIANEVAPYIQNYFVNAHVLRPTIKHLGGVDILHPVFANAVGFYKLALGRYGHE